MPKLHYNSKLLWFFPQWVNGFTFGQHIFLRRGTKETYDRTIDHERVHAEQYEKHGIIKFLWIYFVKEFRVPYREKTFEKEAYSKTEHIKGGTK